MSSTICWWCSSPAILPSKRSWASLSAAWAPRISRKGGKRRPAKEAGLLVKEAGLLVHESASNCRVLTLYRLQPRRLGGAQGRYADAAVGGRARESERPHRARVHPRGGRHLSAAQPTAQFLCRGAAGAARRHHWLPA